jgi:RNA polymerase sigma-70 factor (ECF subfamily)
LRPLVARFFSRPFEREEAVQEVWLLVLRMSPSYDPSRGDLLPWLRALAANRCKELLRALGRRPGADEQLSDDTLVELSNPEQAAAAQRLQVAVARFEATLSAEEARVFRLSIIEERPHDEVATLLGLSVRRCKYLRMKLLTRAALEPALRAALAEVLES